jgi:hypothetical protein
VPKTTYPLRLPASIKTAAARLAKADGVSLNQFIAVAVAEKVGVLETAQAFLDRRAGKSAPRDLLKFLRQAADESQPKRMSDNGSIAEGAERISREAAPRVLRDTLRATAVKLGETVVERRSWKRCLCVTCRRSRTCSRSKLA